MNQEEKILEGQERDRQIAAAIEAQEQQSEAEVTRKITEFLDQFEWEPEDLRMIGRIKRRACAPYIFQRTCLNTGCIYNVNGFCPRGTATEKPSQCRDLPFDENKGNGCLNQEVPLKAICRQLVRERNQANKQSRIAMEQVDAVKDYLNAEGFLSYRSKLDEAEKKIKAQAEEIYKLKYQLSKTAEK